MVKKYKIHLIAAARPNFVKIAPLYHELLKRSWASPVIVHTGQHYDASLSATFFQDLLLPEPHFNLGIGSGSHAEQTGKVMMAYEKILLDDRPDLVVVVGDVNSTLATALAAVKLGVKVAHLEAGLRSFDRTMPEEINRIVTDTVADLLWTPSQDGDENLSKEGVAREKIKRVGNIMIDTIEMLKPKIQSCGTWQELGLVANHYAVVTLHRPSNVDQPSPLTAILEALIDLAAQIPVVFPIHPRTKKNLERFGLLKPLASLERIICLSPLSYLPFMNLLLNCRFAVTDSGGIQEETTYLGIPCITLRRNTERPITITHGTNRLCPAHKLRTTTNLLMQTIPPKKDLPKCWDGKASGRIVDSIVEFFLNSTQKNNLSEMELSAEELAK